jgi:hypothetical protein
MRAGRPRLSLSAYSRIGALSKLLELLEGAGVPSVVHGGHDGNDLAFAEVADADGRVGAVGHSKSPRVRGFELADGGWARRELGVPENGRCGGELAGDAQGGARVVGRGIRGGGGWLRRGGRRTAGSQRVSERRREDIGRSSDDSSVAIDVLAVGGFEAARIAESWWGHVQSFGWHLPTRALQPPATMIIYSIARFSIASFPVLESAAVNGINILAPWLLLECLHAVQ